MVSANTKEIVEKHYNADHQFFFIIICESDWNAQFGLKQVYIKNCHLEFEKHSLVMIFFINIDFSKNVRRLKNSTYSAKKRIQIFSM